MADEDSVGAVVVDAAVAVHRSLGPGLLESVYEIALAHEIGRRGVGVARQVPIRVDYGDLTFEEAFRADLLVDGIVVVEVKSLEALARVHHQQIRTYLRLSGRRLGFLLNFGAALMKDGIVRVVNGLGR